MRKRNSFQLVAGLCLLILSTACGGDNLFEGYGAAAGGNVGTIEGTVTAAGAPLGAVPIILVGRDSTMTNGDGLYRFEDLPASTYTVAIRVPLNYEPVPGDSVTRTVRLAGGSVEAVNWRLQARGVAP